MKNISKKQLGGVALSALAVASLGSAGCASLAQGQSADVSVAPATGEVVQQADAAAPEFVAVRADAVSGQFAFSQDAVSSNTDISSRFAKAAAVLCGSASENLREGLRALNLVVTNGESGFSATMGEGVSEEQRLKC